MEQVLSVYERSYNPDFPVVCLDESLRQPVEIKEERKQAGTQLQDSEHTRKGIAEIYMAFEPLAGKRYVSIENDHTAKSWVKVVSALLDKRYKNCRKIT